jgi:hypothetical protein
VMIGFLSLHGTKNSFVKPVFFRLVIHQLKLHKRNGLENCSLLFEIYKFQFDFY